MDRFSILNLSVGSSVADDDIILVNISVPTHSKKKFVPNYWEVSWVGVYP